MNILYILDYVFCISCGYVYYVFFFLCFFFFAFCSHCAFSTSYHWVWVFGDHLHDLFTVASHKESV